MKQREILAKGLSYDTHATRRPDVDSFLTSSSRSLLNSSLCFLCETSSEITLGLWKKLTECPWANTHNMSFISTSTTKNYIILCKSVGYYTSNITRGCLSKTSKHMSHVKISKQRTKKKNKMCVEGTRKIMLKHVVDSNGVWYECSKLQNNSALYSLTLGKQTDVSDFSYVFRRSAV